MKAAIEPARHKQLFLDDGSIEHLSGIKRTLHRPEKQGVVLSANRSLGQTRVQSRNSPQWNPEKDVWEWWYWAFYENRTSGTETFANHLAVSSDGIHWDSPELELDERDGSKQRDIVWGPKPRTLYHVLRDEREHDPSRKYKGLLDTTERQLATSPDGFDWTLLDVPPIPSDDESQFFYDPYNDQFAAMVKHSTEWGRSIWLSTSNDFQSFSEAKLVFHTDSKDTDIGQERIQQVLDDPDYLSPPLVDDFNHIAQTYHMAVLPYEGLYVGFALILNPSSTIPPPWCNYTGLNQIELVVSRDLHHWDRVADRGIFIGVEPWDELNYLTSQTTMAGQPTIYDNKEIWIYHGANRFRGPMAIYPKEYQKYANDSGALYLSKLRLDGFVSLDADEHGTVLSSPFVLTGGELHINCDARNGLIRAELVDAETSIPLPGLSALESNPIRGDHLDETLTWKTRQVSSQDRPVKIRFILEHARLYAFWIA